MSFILPSSFFMGLVHHQPFFFINISGNDPFLSPINSYGVQVLGCVPSFWPAEQGDCQAVKVTTVVHCLLLYLWGLQWWACSQEKKTSVREETHSLLVYLQIVPSRAVAGATWAEGSTEMSTRMFMWVSIPCDNSAGIVGEITAKYGLN